MTPLRARILVVEDDHGLRAAIVRGLREEHFDPVAAADGRDALRAVDGRVDAVVLDIGLPDSDGRDVCQAMRAAGIEVPVLFLTARENLTDRLSGFAAGGDDYLCKPFHIAELAARLRASLRRARVAPAAVPTGPYLDPATHALHDGPDEIGLTPTEFRILACLMAAPGAAVRRRVLVRAGWPEGAYVHANTLEQYITRLRRKLRETATEQHIDAVRGVGYRYR
jgi:two-component system response regulator MprA